MPEPEKSRYKSAGAVAVLAAITAIVTLAVYLPSLSNGFVNWDDPRYVYANYDIRSLDLRFLSWVMVSETISNWHPLTMISHAVDYALWGLDPFGHHLTSVLMHALNTALVSILAFRLASLGVATSKGRAPLVAGVITGLLFGLHPLHVESVAWISERKDVLSGLFYILSLMAYLKYSSSSQRSAAWYAAALLGLALALMSKPMAMSLPFVLLLVDFYLYGRPGYRWASGGVARIILEKAPFFALSAASGVLSIWAQSKGEAVQTLGAMPVIYRFATAVRGYAFYIYKMFLPVNLAPYYPLPGKGEFFDLRFLVSLLVLLGISAYCIYVGRRKRFLPAIWLYFLITLGPVIGLVQVGAQSAADRYMYLPSLGPFLLVALGAGWLLKRYDKRILPALAGVTVVVSALMAYGTVVQAGIWKDSVTLWTHEIGLYPDKVFVAYANRGNALMDRGDYEAAFSDLSKAIALRPEDARVYLNRGITSIKLGDPNQALRDFNVTLALKPDSSLAYANRGGTLVKMGDLKGALADFDRAIGLEPGDATYYVRRGTVHARAGRILPAIDDFTRAIERDRGYKEAYYNRALGYSTIGKYRLALDDLTAAIGLDDRYVNAYNNRGIVYINMGEYERAVKDFTEAIRLDPTDAGAYRNRGYAYERLGNPEQAAKDIMKSYSVK